LGTQGGNGAMLEDAHGFRIAPHQLGDLPGWPFFKDAQVNDGLVVRWQERKHTAEIRLFIGRHHGGIHFIRSDQLDIVQRDVG
jgi:hypothetical protein